MSPKTILIDGREFVPGKKTGIARFLEGLLEALIDSDLDLELLLAVSTIDAVPYKFQKNKKMKLKKLPLGFLAAEKTLKVLTRQDVSLFFSPYPKLPLLGQHCLAVNTIHDVLDLSHQVYKRRFRTFFDYLRLKIALKKASLTWYDSSWSLMETQKCAGFVGKNPRVRHLAIDERFTPVETKGDNAVLEKYRLQRGYIIIIGNGLAHKNLGVLLKVTAELSNDLVFIGVSGRNRKYWQTRYPHAQPTWIEYIEDEELPAIIRGAFCLAQPSTAEGYGYPPLEAMAAGKPTVISNLPVLVETTGGHSLAADPSDSQMWIKAFQALEEKDFYQLQVEKGLKWVAPLRGRGGWTKHVTDLEELLRDL